MLTQITERVIRGEALTKTDIYGILTYGTAELGAAADRIKQHFCGSKVDLCSIINGKGGACSENCKFCAQGSARKGKYECFGFIDEDTILTDCRLHRDAGVHRYSIVTAGKTLNDSDFEKAASAYARLNKECPGIELCGSHGLLTYEQLLKLKKSGINRYHCNIETSRAYFKNICTTHTFDDKLKTIENAKKAGLEICSGGIIGMGESMDDRIDMAFTLAELDVKSIPINVLMPIPGTPLENASPISEDEILKTVAIFRFVNPRAEIRIAAGRKMISGNGLKAFCGGANATITGNMLTTTGSTIDMDKKMLSENGFEI